MARVIHLSEIQVDQWVHYIQLAQTAEEEARAAARAAEEKARLAATGAEAYANAVRAVHGIPPGQQTRLDHRNKVMLVFEEGEDPNVALPPPPAGPPEEGHVPTPLPANRADRRREAAQARKNGGRENGGAVPPELAAAVVEGAAADGA
jgi:hypothetical protein